MNDVATPAYYDPTPPPPPKPWWQERRTFALAGLVLLALGALILVGFFATNVLTNYRLSAGKATKEQVSTLAANLAQECDSDDAACAVRAQADAARALATAEACAELENEALASCVSLIARDTRDPKICNDLSGQEKDGCSDNAYLELAVAETDLSLCDKITNSSLGAACVQRITTIAVANNTCGVLGVEPSLCTGAMNMRAAVATGDPTVCNDLPTADERYECNRGINSVDDDRDGLVLADEVALGTSDLQGDTDSDGLTDGDEVHLHKTDPRNADTDGDGYADGGEVAAGYNPLG